MPRGILHEGLPVSDRFRVQASGCHIELEIRASHPTPRLSGSPTLLKKEALLWRVRSKRLLN
jgi:hypothetical protein